nr:succinate--hydroxymethylglutarate CoA-transferase-like [Nerophis lumbriciformis]
MAGARSEFGRSTRHRTEETIRSPLRSSRFVLPALFMAKPLSDVVVLDLSRVLSGPFATQQLIDLGATVTKIEHPTNGDDTRRFGPPFLGDESTYFISINRGKRSVAVDLKQERGKKVVWDLAMKADVIIENFRPGTATRLGLGHDALREKRPELITCSISGYGTAGDERYEGLPGYDAVLQAVTGLMSLTGEPGGEPTKVGVAISDMVAGLYAAQGILAALYERKATGVGRHVEVSMQDAIASLLTYQAGIYFATDRNPARMGNAHPSICPYETVETKDGLYALAVGNDAQFGRLLEKMQLTSLAEDSRFVTNRSRVENRAALMAQLCPVFKQHTRGEWDAMLRDANVPGGPVLEVSQALEHPQLNARGSILEHDHPTAGKVRTIASAPRFDGEAPIAVAPPPRLGEHTSEVLKETLGYDDATIAELMQASVIRGSET